MRFKYDLGGGAELTAISDYAKASAYDLEASTMSASAISYLNSLTTAKVENWSEEVRLFKDFSGTRLTSGLYYLHIDWTRN